MSVKINSLLLYQHNNQQVVEVGGRTVGECLQNLVGRYPELKKTLFDPQGNLNSYLALYVNKEDIALDDLARPVKDGDEIHLIVLIEGG